jgi:hypothetical protein
MRTWLAQIQRGLDHANAGYMKIRLKTTIPIYWDPPKIMREAHMRFPVAASTLELKSHRIKLTYQIIMLILPPGMDIAIIWFRLNIITSSGRVFPE